MSLSRIHPRNDTFMKKQWEKLSACSRMGAKKIRNIIGTATGMYTGKKATTTQSVGAMVSIERCRIINMDRLQQYTNNL